MAAQQSHGSMYAQYYSSDPRPSSPPSHSLHTHPISAHQHLQHQQQTRSRFDKSQSAASLTPFAQFLKEDDDRFYETFPAARQQNWVVLGDDYRTFSGGAGFNANHGVYASSASPIHSPNGLDVMYPSLYHHPDTCSPQTSYPYSLDPNPCVGIPSGEPFNQLRESTPLSQNLIPSTQFDFNPAPFYPHLTTDSQVLHQHSSISLRPQPSPPSGHLHSPQLQHESPLDDFLRSPTMDSAFSPPLTENSHPQLYSVSPEATVAGSSPAPVLSLPPSSLSPVENPEQQFTLPPPPRESLSDSESPTAGDDSSGPSSTKVVLPKSSSTKRKRRRNFSEELQSKSPRNYMYGKIPLDKPAPPAPTAAPKVPKSRPTPTTSQSEKKSLALACFFCRGRKIACGPQDPTSSDRTCNQCHRRSLKCEYPTESRRGMRKRKSGVNQSFQDEQSNVPESATSAASKSG
ncbi:hypothetical protein D9757_005408 [Collybiopsis confluens]|uniref:Zn(2)-C6 fungal-type domain-containing protein n=1 Tax=Collybiopsis confluens TaxID=2823264 RepID=A0A8H5M9A0_9AGAR|nr:hypothetical protein D9757_005408 [Collybiopsis confluens]